MAGFEVITEGAALVFKSQLRLKELDEAATELNVSLQAVIKIFLRQALDQHYLARKARLAG